MPSLSILNLKRPGREPLQGLTRIPNGKLDENTTDEDSSRDASLMSPSVPMTPNGVRKRDLLTDRIIKSFRIAAGRSFSAPQRGRTTEPQASTAVSELVMHLHST